MPAFLLAFREGLEAALILGIALSVLHRVGQRRQTQIVWLGAGLAALTSLGLGAGLYALGLGFEGKAEEVFEGIAMLLAAGLLTWMIFWMARRGKFIQTEVEQGVHEAALGGGRWALFSLTFVAVLREGTELALFLSAAAFTATAGTTLVGGLLGLMAAGLAGWLLFATTARLNVGAFFRVTGILLIFFAAGLVAHGIHELNEAGIIPVVIESVWNVNPILDEKSGVGQILTGLLGYNGNPSLTEVVSYVGYWVALLLALARKGRQVEPATAQE